MNMSSKYGADTVRGYLMFIGPWDMGGPWDPSAIEGVSRFLYRVWSVVVDEPKATVVARPTAASCAIWSASCTRRSSRSPMTWRTSASTRPSPPDGVEQCTGHARRSRRWSDHADLGREHRRPAVDDGADLPAHQRRTVAPPRATGQHPSAKLAAWVTPPRRARTKSRSSSRSTARYATN